MKVTVSDIDSFKVVDVAPDEVFVYGVEKLNCSQRKGQFLINEVTKMCGYGTRTRDDRIQNMIAINNKIWNMTDKEFEEIMKKRV